MPDSSDCQRTREDSKTSMEKTAPDIAPTAAPLTKPLSVSWPIKAPVIAPNKVPTNAKKKVKIAEKMFPITADTAKWKVSLTLSKKFTNKDDEEEAKTDGCAIKSIVRVIRICTKIKLGLLRLCLKDLLQKTNIYK